jgi:hypothetical protein
MVMEIKVSIGEVSCDVRLDCYLFDDRIPSIVDRNRDLSVNESKMSPS